MNGRRSLLRTVGAASVLGVPTAGCLGGDGGPPTVLGTYPGPDLSKPATYRPFERWLDRRHAVLLSFFEAEVPRRRGDAAVAHQLTAAWDAGAVPLLTWEPFLGAPSGPSADESSDGSPTPVTSRIADGEVDALLDRWGALLAAWLDADGDRRLYFRPMHEMNGDWYPWGVGSGATPEAYVAAWRRLRTAMRGAGVPDDRMRWVWCPNATDAGGAPATAFYPGDGAVDWVGVDGFNFGDSRAWSGWRWPEEVFGDALSRLRGLTDLPVAVPEVATSSVRGGGHDPRAKSRWIRRAFDVFDARDVALACWFNVDKETDWAVFGGARGTATYTDDGTSYRVYRAYREAAASPDVVGAEAAASPRNSRDAFAGRF
ncbi:MAG: glycoside hydrolase family 26 protein [Haloferacaceae archaeon]